MIGLVEHVVAGEHVRQLAAVIAVDGDGLAVIIPDGDLMASATDLQFLTDTQCVGAGGRKVAGLYHVVGKDARHPYGC